MIFLKRLFFVIVIFHLLASSSIGFFAEATSELLKDNVVFLDLRKNEEFKKNHIKRSVNLSFDFLWQTFQNNPEDFFSSLVTLGVTPEKKVIIVTEKNGRKEITSAMALSYMLAYGNYKNVRVLMGGIAEWQKKRLPLVTVGDEVSPAVRQISLRNDFFYNLKSKKRKGEKVVLLTLEKNISIPKSFQKESLVIRMDKFFNDDLLANKNEIEEYLKELHISKENVLIVYPSEDKESYALAFLLKYYLNYEKIYLLKGVKTK